ncbi:MAG: serine/threonine protein kinase, partial [Myxococcales bacterium]|nr:serine/threonine protein kinase [Myxococcales bacterium]
IGEGGMGAVFRCHSTLSDAMKAAVKVLKANEVSQGRERFVQELQTLAGLSHPGIVRVLGGGEDRERDLLFLVMELVSGESLASQLTRAPLPPGEAVELTRRIAESLAHAHEVGVFHRDVKPSNVMLAPGGAKLIDFGIARSAQRGKLTVAGTVTGTMAYLPPESFQVDDPDPALADVYALGMTLHEALTAAHPFGDDTTSSASLGRMVAMKLGSQPLDPGSAFGQDLRELVKSATHPDPAQRIPSMAAFAEALAGLGIVAARPAPAAKPPMTVSAVKSQEVPKEAVKEAVAAAPARRQPSLDEEPAPASRSGGTSMVMIGGAALVLLFAIVAIGVVVGMGGLAFLASGGSEDRVVEVTIDGQAPDVVTVDGEPMAREGGVWTAKLSPGLPRHVRAATGPGASSWTGGACPACTACVEEELVVGAGDGPQRATLTLAEPVIPPRDVLARAPRVPEGEVTFTLDGAAPASSERAEATFSAVAAGAHAVVASVGTCKDADAGCTASGQCPEGCA